MTARTNIIRKIRAARGETAPPVPLPPTVGEALYANYPANNDSLLDRFEAALAPLKGEVFKAQGLAEATQQLAGLLAEIPENQVTLQNTSLVEAACRDHGRLRTIWSTRHSQQDLTNQQFGEFKASVTVCDALVARTGSVMLNSISAGGRRLSVLPELHIVLAKESQLVPDIDHWLQQLERNPEWTYAVNITGPSRTADIEKILVLGAHGPKRLAVILIKGH